MKTVFFEVQPWEAEILKQVFPDAVLSSDKLTVQNAESFKDAEVVSCFIYSDINKEVVAMLPNLQCIATRSTGYDHINLAACKERGVVVCNVPEYGSNTVAEHTFALLLSLTRKIPESIRHAKDINFDHSQITGVDLCGKTIGIIGMGKIGQHVARIAKGFEMNVIATNRTQDEALAQSLGFKYVSLDELIKNSDVVTLHVPLTPATTHTINKENIKSFKKGSYLINTARGGLADTEAVMIGLNEGILAGVGLDVFEDEKDLCEEAAFLNSRSDCKVDYKTMLMNHILIDHPNVVITPHNAFNSFEAIHRILNTTIDNVQKFLGKSPQNKVE